MKERLEKLRFTEVISYMNDSELTGKAAQNKRQEMLKKKSTMVPGHMSNR